MDKTIQENEALKVEAKKREITDVQLESFIKQCKGDYNCILKLMDKQVVENIYNELENKKTIKIDEPTIS